MTNKKLFEAIKLLHEETLTRISEVERNTANLIKSAINATSDVRCYASAINNRTAAMQEDIKALIPNIEKLLPSEGEAPVDVPPVAVTEEVELFAEEKSTSGPEDADPTEVVERKAVLGGSYRHRATKNSKFPTLVYLKHLSTHLRDYRSTKYTPSQLRNICEGEGIEVHNAATDRSRANGKKFDAAIEAKDADRLIEIVVSGKWK